MKEFRAWNPENRQMLYNVAVQDGKHVTPEQTSGCDYWDAVLVPNNNIVIQFTGLLDKNGKKIFEGDIVRRIIETPSKFHFQIYDPSPLISQIFYDKAAFFVKGVAGMDLYLGAVHERIEVIGNIFENPELLEANAKI